MPMAVIAQPIKMAPTSARAAMFCGNEKMPPPIIEPTTRAIRALSRSFWAGWVMQLPRNKRLGDNCAHK
ncbi:hypothetical protein PFLmoz3_00561 [Pseudomonas fluorescens]|uniref:Uncharacterized protein n=1 Tax=Pseudomonas fluorescens TaxID=294 RepID=A0A109LKY1_PSEFL|nr:hypothetical protein PFLmoz3_00561 [Pseudomonas fluorescens]